MNFFSVSQLPHISITYQKKNISPHLTVSSVQHLPDQFYSQTFFSLFPFLRFSSNKWECASEKYLEGTICYVCRWVKWLTDGWVSAFGEEHERKRQNTVNCHFLLICHIKSIGFVTKSSVVMFLQYIHFSPFFFSLFTSVQLAIVLCIYADLIKVWTMEI